MSKPTSPLLSIITISYNTKQITLDYLESIYTSGIGTTPKPYEWEVIVIDNGSSDGSVESLMAFAKTHKEVRVLDHKKNDGFAKGNNIAVKEARGTYLLFLNSDILVQEGAIDNLLHYYELHNKTVHFLGGKLIEKDGTTPQPSCGPFYTLPVVFGALFLRGDYWGLTRGSPTTPQQVDWVSGACILTTRERYDAIGGFDETIFMYMEEIDLLYRARKKGYRTEFFPDAQFIHFGSASSGGRTFPIIQVYRGFLYFYKKHYGPFAVLLLRGMLQLKSIIAIAIGVITGRTYLITTYVKALHIATMD